MGGGKTGLCIVGGGKTGLCKARFHKLNSAWDRPDSESRVLANPVLEHPNSKTPVFTKPLRYDPGITSVMPLAGGCLTRKKTKRCLAV